MHGLIFQSGSNRIKEINVAHESNTTLKKTIIDCVVISQSIFLLFVYCAPSGVLNEEYQVRGNLATDIGRDLVVRKSKCCV